MALTEFFFFYFFGRISSVGKYRCERGYKIVGEPLVTCEENGQWSGAVPECVCEYFGEKINKTVNTITIPC